MRGAGGGRHEPFCVSLLFEPYFLRPLNSLSSNQAYAGVDLVFVVTTIMSLLAVLLGHDLVSREQEAGTLRMILSHAVSRDLVLVAKWLGGFAILLVSTGVLLGVAFLLLYVLPTEFSLRGEWGRMLGMGAISVLLLSAVFTLGLLVSCRCKQSVNALVLLLFVWVVFVAVVPSISPYVAGFIAPTPSVEELMYRKLALSLEVDPPRGKSTLSMGEFQEKAGALEEEFQRRMEAQIQVTQVLSYLSPVATGAQLMADLAGNGLATRGRLTEAVRVFRREYVGYAERLRGPVDWDEMPRLRLEYPDFGDAMGALRPGLTVLVLYNVLAFMGAHLAFLRQDLTA